MVTGHTGFKGSWLAIWLHQLGANVFGISLPAPTNPSHYDVITLSDLIDEVVFDIRDTGKIKSLVSELQPDFVFHLAAQPLVNESFDDPPTTWSTNVLGTVNILESLRCLSKNVVAVLITSDKCYENKEWSWGYRETDQLGGADPYSASKASAELAFSSYYKSFFSVPDSPVRIASARAGNVIGGGDWALQRIIPDAFRAYSSGRTLMIRNPASTRPWQHVLEPLSGYLSLAQSLAKDSSLNGESFNFGPATTSVYTVSDIITRLKSHWPRLSTQIIPHIQFSKPESGLLKLSCDKALDQLSWRSVLEIDDTLSLTSQWYSAYNESSCPEYLRNLTVSQITDYTSRAITCNLPWTHAS